jgi:hypothetical protein
MDKILYRWLLKQLKYFGLLSSIAQHFLYVGHFRRFVYDILVLTKYKITTLLVVLNIYTHGPSGSTKCGEFHDWLASQKGLCSME